MKEVWQKSKRGDINAKETEVGVREQTGRGIDIITVIDTMIDPQGIRRPGDNIAQIVQRNSKDLAKSLMLESPIGI